MLPKTVSLCRFPGYSLMDTCWLVPFVVVSFVENSSKDILSTQILDAARLTRHCGLDRWTAAAVLAYETAANMKHQKQRDTVPDDATT